MESSNHVTSRVKLLTDSLGILPKSVTHPAFIVLSGLPGSGKSYFSHQLAEKIPVVVLESDALRKILFPEPSYTARESGLLFESIHVLIDKLLGSGRSVVLDATNLSEDNREILYRIADHQAARLVIIYLEAPDETIKERLSQRLAEPDNLSDADWTVYRRMVASVEKIKRRHYVVNTAQDISPAIDKIADEVVQ